MEQALQHLTLHRSTWEGVDLVIDLVDGLHGIAFKIAAAAVAIDDYQLGRATVLPIRITGFQHTTKRGWDRHPPLRIDLVLAFASEPAAHVCVPACDADAP